MRSPDQHRGMVVSRSYFFFFSSRRRHTRFDCDWSSDVCSSDLVLAGAIQSVEELAPGRVKFVMGTGYTSASTIGRRPASLAGMRECLRSVRALLGGGSGGFGGAPRPRTLAGRRALAPVTAGAGPQAAAALADEVVAELCDALGLIGAPEDCAGRIAEMAKLGVRNLYLMPTLTFRPPAQEIAAFRDVVFPRLREAGLTSGA